jgi:hypothetical protein
MPSELPAIDIIERCMYGNSVHTKRDVWKWEFDRQKFVFQLPLPNFLTLMTAVVGGEGERERRKNVFPRSHLSLFTSTFHAFCRVRYARVAINIGYTDSFLH